MTKLREPSLYRRSCPSCGFAPSFHREVDAVVDRVQAGENVVDVAQDYDWSPEMLRVVMIARCTR